jgi:hypothetical protein
MTKEQQLKLLILRRDQLIEEVKTLKAMLKFYTEAREAKNAAK